MDIPMNVHILNKAD